MAGQLPQRGSGFAEGCLATSQDWIRSPQQETKLWGRRLSLPGCLSRMEWIVLRNRNTPSHCLTSIS